MEQQHDDAWELRRTAARLWPGARARWAAPPLVGYLEAPRGATRGGEVALAGWLFGLGGRVERLWVRAGGRELTVEHGLERPDLEAAFPRAPGAGRAGFRGVVEVADGEAIELWAALSSGRRVRAFRVEPAARPRPLRTARTPRAPRTPVVRPMIDSLVDAARARLTDARSAARFAELLERAAGDEWPALAASGTRLHPALAAAWRADGGDAASLGRALAPTGITPPAAEPARTTERRRLLVVSGMFPSVAHGGGLRLFDLLRALGERHEIDLYSVFREDLDSDSLEALRTSLRAIRLVRSHRIDAADVSAWISRRRAPRYDAVHFEYPESAPAAAALRAHGRRAIFTFMECLTRARLLDLSRTLEHDPGPTAAALVRAWDFERRAVASCHATVAVNDVDARFIARAFGATPLVVPTCVSDWEIGRHLDGDEAARAPTALFVGYWDHPPNLHGLAWYLDRVHRQVQARVPGYRLLVVGRGDLSPLRARHASDPAIEWIGAVDALVPALRRGRVGLAPLHTGAGIRGKINQYAAVGRPSVATRLAAAGLPYRDGEGILLADGADEFAAATARLLTDDALWERLRARARDQAAGSFGWDAHVPRLEALHG